METAREMIKPRDRASEEIVKQQDVIFHLILVIRGAEGWQRARYIAPFVELGSLEQKIQETVQDFDTVVPSGAFLSELLHSPVCGMPGVEELRIPLVELEGSITFIIPYEKEKYTKHCYRNLIWSFDKLLYTVVIDTPKTRTDKYDNEEQYVTSVEVEATFASLNSAVGCVNEVVARWNKEKGDTKAEAFPVERDSRRGVLFTSDQKTELKHVRIITRDLWQAGALKSTKGSAIVLPPEDRSGFTTRRRVTVRFAQATEAKTSVLWTTDDVQIRPKKRVLDDAKEGIFLKMATKQLRTDEDKQQKGQGLGDQIHDADRICSDDAIGSEEGDRTMRDVQMVQDPEAKEVEDTEMT